MSTPFDGASPIGIHLEGPFISALKRGTHKAANVAAPFVVAAVRVRDTPVYRRLFGFEPISGPQGYAGLTVPMVLMAADGAKQWADGVRRHVREGESRRRLCA